MTANDRPTFDARDVVAIALQLAPDDETFIIGGQALNIWVTYFHEMAPDEFGSKEYYTSEDIDYCGSRAAVRSIALALDGQFRFPDADDHTPSTGQVVAKLGGKNLTIDFLGTVLGIKDPELRNGVSVIEIEAALDGRRVAVRLKLLHPVLCLKSRIINMLHPAVRRTGPMARKQLQAAVIVVRCFIDNALQNADGWREARDCFSTLYSYLRSDPYVRDADIALGIDILDIIRAFIDDERVDSRYREYQLKRMIANIEKRRATRR